MIRSNRRALAVFLSALLLSLSAAGAPAAAHGNEKHGEAASAAPSAGQPGQDATMPPGMASGAEDGGHGSGGHEEAAGGHDAEPASFVGVLKRLHPATIHFPIALFMMAALTELFAMTRRGEGLESAVRVMIYGGAAGAVVAVLFGWIHTGIWFGGDAVMQVHRWTGTLLAVFGLLLAWLAKAERNSRAALRALLFIVAATLVVQGFLGGELAHGPDHLKIF